MNQSPPKSLLPASLRKLNPTPLPTSATNVQQQSSTTTPSTIQEPTPSVTSQPNSNQSVVPKPENIPGPPVEYPGLLDLQTKIASLSQALTTAHPMMDSLLQTIHRNLQKDPELVHMLKPEDTAILFAGLQKKTQTKIVTDTVKSASSGRGKGLKNISIEDL